MPPTGSISEESRGLLTPRGPVEDGSWFGVFFFVFFLTICLLDPAFLSILPFVCPGSSVEGQLGD